MIKIWVIKSGVRTVFLALQDCFLCPHVAFPLCVSMERKGSLWSVSSYKDTNPVRLGPHPHELT